MRSTRAGAAASRRLFVQVLFLAVVLAVVVAARLWVLEGYFIPTPSMEPTFMGRPEGGDKVVVDKTRFRRAAPERWEIAVFSRDDHPGAYIKRIVGLPGDELLIRHGDLFNHTQIVRKPPARLAELLVPVYRSGAGFDGFSDVWEMEGGSRLAGDGGLALFPDRGQDLVLQTRQEITDGYLGADGTLSKGLTPVGDLEVALAFEAGADLRALDLVIAEAPDCARFQVARRGPARLLLDGRIVATLGGVRLEPHRVRSFAFSNIDDRLLLSVDGRPAAAVPYESAALAPFPPSGLLRRNRVRIVFHGQGRVNLRRLDLKRDLYYTDAGHDGVDRPVVLGRDRYFLLGDNSRNSSDSREWGPVAGRCLIGAPIMILWPPGRFRVF